MTFGTFNAAFKANFDRLVSESDSRLYVVDIDGDTLWNTYLESFPPGSNPIFRVRREYDCTCCRSFIKHYGKIVAIKNNRIVSVWDDLDVEHPFNVVASSLSALIHSRKIRDIFLSGVPILGTIKSRDAHADIVWEHFNLKAPRSAVKQASVIDTLLGNFRTAREVFDRALKELSIEALDTVLELIDQNSLYRGQEHAGIVRMFRSHKIAYSRLTSDKEKENYTWTNANDDAGSRFKNTVIGTLVSDISEGVDLDRAVSSFESKVAPTNYKRPTALVTKGMIESAKKTVHELGIEDSLQRRHARLSDITINNLMFANRQTKVALTVFDEMADDLPSKITDRELSKIEEISLEDFLSKVVPKSTSIEISMENRLSGNLMSLIAPANPSAPNILKWSNNFSWVYTGSLSDSIKEQVKRAGGNVSGVLRVSLAWYNYDDLDLHVIEPDGNEIHFGRKENHKTSGKLDVDMNVSPTTRSAVENITWTNKARMLKGTYQVTVHNYTHRETVDVGFLVEIEYDGSVKQFPYTSMVRNKEVVKVATFTFDQINGMNIVSSIPESSLTKSVWGIKTNQFVEVAGISKSPNYWDENRVGNAHVFFYLKGCKNPDKVRGLFNEYLISNLDQHRKVFEILGTKLMVDPSEEQLSGLGFSLTKRDHFVCKVAGSFNRILKVVI